MARVSSRKYHNVTELTEVQLVCIGAEHRPGKSNLTTTVAFHPKGAVMVREEKGRTEFLMAHEGAWHEQVRMTNFDEPHMKRVVGTVVQDVLDFKEKQRNLIMRQKPTKTTKEK